MTALILTSEFAEEAYDAGRQLLTSKQDAIELFKTPGYFVGKAEVSLPEGSTEVYRFELEGVKFTLYTIA